MTISVAQANKSFIALEEQPSIDTPAAGIQPIWFDTNGAMNVNDILTDVVKARIFNTINLGSIADDAVAIYELGLVVSAVAMLIPNSGSAPLAFIWLRTLSLTTPILIGSGTNASSLTLSSGVLAGSTGTDTKLNFSANSNGNIYLENRLGSTMSAKLVFFGE